MSLPRGLWGGNPRRIYVRHMSNSNWFFFKYRFFNWIFWSLIIFLLQFLVWKIYPMKKTYIPTFIERCLADIYPSFLGFPLWIGNVFLHLYNLYSLDIEEMNIITIEEIEGSSMISLITSISKIKIHFKTLLDQMSAQRQRMRREEHKRALRELLEERQRRR